MAAQAASVIGPRLRNLPFAWLRPNMLWSRRVTLLGVSRRLRQSPGCCRGAANPLPFGRSSPASVIWDELKCGRGRGLPSPARLLRRFSPSSGRLGNAGASCPRPHESKGRAPCHDVQDIGLSASPRPSCRQPFDLRTRGPAVIERVSGPLKFFERLLPAAARQPDRLAPPLWPVHPEWWVLPRIDLHE